MWRPELSDADMAGEPVAIVEEDDRILRDKQGTPLKA
jgi:hypothetical protein